MLACVCLNPSFDRTVSLRSFTAGDVNRVLSARQDVGGKGINVAITARRLGIASCVLGCASVMTEGTQLIRPDDFAALLPQVQIQDV